MAVRGAPRAERFRPSETGGGFVTRRYRFVRVLAALAVAAGLASCEDSSDDRWENWVDAGSLSVSAKSVGGATFVAGADGVYRFRIVSGAYSLVTPRVEWETELLYYKNRPIGWVQSGKFQDQQGYTGILDYWRPAATAAEAEAAGIGAYVTLRLKANEYVIFVVPDCQECFGNNTGTVNLAVDLAQ